MGIPVYVIFLAIIGSTVLFIGCLFMLIHIVDTMDKVHKIYKIIKTKKRRK